MHIVLTCMTLMTPDTPHQGQGFGAEDNSVARSHNMLKAKVCGGGVDSDTGGKMDHGASPPILPWPLKSHAEISQSACETGLSPQELPLLCPQLPRAAPSSPVLGRTCGSLTVVRSSLQHRLGGRQEAGSFQAPTGYRREYSSWSLRRATGGVFMTRSGRGVDLKLAVLQDESY